MTKDQYAHFKNIYLSEKKFRECWGKEYEDLIERRNGLRKTGHILLARRLDTELNLLGRVFMSLEEFRVGDCFVPNKTIHIPPKNSYKVNATLVSVKKGTIKNIDRTQIEL